MNWEETNYTRLDLLIAILLAALMAAWLVVFSAILIQYGVHGG